MADITAILLVLGIVLAVVTVIGHGIWVLVAYFFGGSRRRARQDDFGFRKVATPPRPNDVDAALRALRTQLDELVFDGALDAGAHDRLTSAIAEEERRLAAARLSDTEPPTEAIELTPVSPHVVMPAAPEPATTLAAASAAPSVPVSDVPAPPPATVHERARKYAASREAAAVEMTPTSVPDDVSLSPIESPNEPAVPVSRLLAAFMEENNIRWGELVGGLLIVGCSIALVISLWSKIENQPLLQFVLFNGVTAALFGVGMYTDRRWKIHTTSHGVLVIATLLVPLNFLALAAYTQAAPPANIALLAGETASIAVFALLVYLAGRTLVPNDATLLMIGVMVPCLMQLLVRRFADPGMPLSRMYALAAVPVLSYLVTTLIAARRSWQCSRHTPCAAAEEPDPSADGSPTRHPAEPAAGCPEPATLDETHANRALTLLGTVSAATLMPLGLLAYNVPPLRTTLHWLSPLLAVCGLPALQTGLLFWRRMADRQKSGLQTAGIGVGVLGAMVMATAVALAWPDPATLLPTALATAAAMLIVAAGFGVPAAHVPAGISIAAAWLIGFYLLRGNVSWTTAADSFQMQSVLLSATSGQVLLPLVALFGGLAWWLRRVGRNETGFMYGLVTAATAAASLGLVVWFGFARQGDPSNITWTLAVYAAIALAAALIVERPAVARVGSALLLAALIQGVVYRYAATWQLDKPWIVALLAHASLIGVACATVGFNVAGTLRVPSALTAAKRLEIVRALLWSAYVTSIAAAIWLAATLNSTTAGTLAIYVAWLATVWMLLAALAGSPALFTCSQFALLLAGFSGITSVVESRDWYTTAQHPWLDPWFVEAQGIALAAYCVVFGVLRRLVSHLTEGTEESVIEAAPTTWQITASRLLNPPWPAIDRVAEIAVIVILAVVATYAVVPGVAQEMSPNRGIGRRAVPPIEVFQIAGIPHTHAADRGAWLMLGSVAVAIAAGLWRRTMNWRIFGLLVAAMALCPLIAAHWEPEVAVASALRWLTAGFFAIASIVLWLVKRRGNIDYATMRSMLVAFAFLVYVAIGAYVARAALARAEPPREVQDLWSWAVLWALVVGIVAIVLPYARPTSLNVDHLLTRSKYSRLLHARNVMLLFAFAPIAILLAFGVATILDQYPIVGPEPEAWFRQIGWDVSYGVPLLLIALVFVGYAVRDRSAQFAFSAGLLFNTVATIVVILRLARGGQPLQATAWITVAQVNAIIAGIVALAWTTAIAFHNRRSQPSVSSTTSEPADLHPHSPSPPLPVSPSSPWPLLLVTQVAWTSALCAAFLIPAAVEIVRTSPPTSWVAAANGVLGWVAVALAATTAVCLNWRRGVTINGMALLAAGLTAIAAATSSRYWDNGNWQAYHTLMAGCCIAAWLLPLVTRVSDQIVAPDRDDRAPLLWSLFAVRLFGIAAVFLAIWGYGSDPLAPWWTIAALAAISIRNIWIAWHERRSGPMWIAAILFIPAVSILWLDWANQFSPTTSTGGLGEPAEFLWINVLAMAALALVSVWMDRRRAATLVDGHKPRIGLSFHRFAAWAIVLTLFVTTGAGLLADLWDRSIEASALLAWAAWLAAAVTALACLWDPAVRWSVASLYCVGLVAVGLYLDGLDLRPPLFHWALANALASCSLATSALWSVRDRLRATLARLGMPVESTWGSFSGTANSEFRENSTTWEGSGHGWLVPANIIIGVFVLLLVAWIEFVVDDFTQRMVAAYAIGAQAFAIGLLARGAVRTSLQYLALVWGVFFAIGFGWAWLPPDFQAPWLHRLVVTVAALAVMVVVYGFGLVKFLPRENEWTRAAARLVPALAVVAAMLVFLVLGIEVSAFVENGSVPIAMPALVAVGLALAGLAVAALAAALLPGRDPLGLSERGRTVYVYIAEGLAALLFLHIRVTMPWLFRDWFLQFWPLVVMGVAFLGVGVGEVFQRRRQRVLSEPLQTTGALLPLLPVFGFWVISSEVHYSLLLLAIGVLYAALSALRQSFFYAVLAALAANGSLWYVLHETEKLSFLEHPQLWLIPPALCALVAGYINRARLTPQQSAALRYASAIVIYVSSTADVFINGVAEAPWLPAVLAGLSILGVLAGIMLRVRAFLYLGTAFLVVALITIIWHAAIHQQRTYILWVAGIIAGALIIALFGLFEKRRDDVLRVVEELKHWQA